ncbi:MAG: hypothetical protein JNJ88_18800 [Planctomycetes bacterium]|nr:hypothetical protein [Planctomycetota bacterium]
MRPASIVLPAAAIAAFLGFLGVVSWTAYHRKLEEAQARAEEAAASERAARALIQEVERASEVELDMGSTKFPNNPDLLRGEKKALRDDPDVLLGTSKDADASWVEDAAELLRPESAPKEGPQIQRAEDSVILVGTKRADPLQIRLTRPQSKPAPKSPQ